MIDAYSHLHDDGIELTLENTDGTTSIIITTSEHPFYSGYQWLRADELETGMLLTTTNGELIISDTSNLLSSLRAYNMTVGETHTYTVGQEQIWVHNDCDVDYLKLKKKLSSEEQISDLKKGKGKPFAGNGTDTPFRDKKRIADTYGGNPDDWAKIKSKTVTFKDGKRYEIHAVQNMQTGEVVEFKTIIEGQL